MKSLAQYITESEEKTYEFRIKIAVIEIDDDMLDRIEHALSAFSVGKLSKPKHLPITDKCLDFPALKHCDVSLITATLKYPCTDEQVRAALGAQARIPLANIVVIPANQPEEQRREEEQDETNEKNKEAILTKDLEKSEGGQPLVGMQRVESMLKELESKRMEFDSKEKVPAAKTTNDSPQYTKSPVTAVKGKK